LWKREREWGEREGVGEGWVFRAVERTDVAEGEEME
jgi:hypothetical protein